MSSWWRRDYLSYLYVLTPLLLAALLFYSWDASTSSFGLPSLHHAAEVDAALPELLSDVVTCQGPWGDVLGSEPSGRLLDGDVPQPYAGSYPDLSLQQTWLTADERYGRYGFRSRGDGPDAAEGQVDWTSVDWAGLQNQCLWRNLRTDEMRAAVLPISPSRKMRLPPKSEQDHWLLSSHTPPRPKHTTGRTAIILRGWSTYEFKDEDFHNMRSLIAETALAWGGRYSVYLLVDVKGEELDVFNSDDDYQSVLDRVPSEFRNMTVLFDQRNFLPSWYPRVLEHSPMFQIEQPRQLFAHHFPEFDHYWQIEMDARFSGNAGEFLRGIEGFARQEPRKQARERASYFFVSGVYGTYANFSSLVDAALSGGSGFWTGVRIPEIEPVGPEPPVARPEDDDFQWGVGEEADVILLSGAMNVTLNEGWVFRNWIHEFSMGMQTPRLASAPAMSRASWNLLNQIHEAQVWKGLSLPSEATPASFALWHGMKISRPPFPIHGEFADNYTPETIDKFLNGGPPDPEHDGMGWGSNSYGTLFSQPSEVDDLGPTWRWNAGFPGGLMQLWAEDDVEAVRAAGARAKLLQIRDGHVYMPNLMLHPVKSNPG